MFTKYPDRKRLRRQRHSVLSYPYCEKGAFQGRIEARGRHAWLFLVRSVFRLVRAITLVRQGIPRIFPPHRRYRTASRYVHRQNRTMLRMSLPCSPVIVSNHDAIIRLSKPLSSRFEKQFRPIVSVYLPRRCVRAGAGARSPVRRPALGHAAMAGRWAARRRRKVLPSRRTK